MINSLSLQMDDPSDSPLTMEMIKAHCAVDGVALEPLLTLYQQAAVTWAEDYMHRSIMSRMHFWTLREFPRLGGCRSWKSWADDIIDHSRYNEIKLPRGKTIAVNGIEYYNSDGNLVHMSGPSGGSPDGGSDFQEDLTSDSGGVVKPLRGEQWPIADMKSITPVRIVYQAGYPTADLVPANIKHALLFAIADMLEIRGTADLASLIFIAGTGRTFDAREALLGRWVIR